MTITDTPMSKATHVSPLPAEAWANKIKGAWQKTVDAIIEAGDLLCEAKKKLSHGKFEEMVEELLPFSVRTAQRLMAISQCRYLKEHRDRLPPCWTTLHALTCLGKRSFDAALKAKSITPEMERSEAQRLILEERKRRARAPASKLPVKKKRARKSMAPKSARDARERTIQWS
jgi:hypothetical protein